MTSKKKTISIFFLSFLFFFPFVCSVFAEEGYQLLVPDIPSLTQTENPRLNTYLIAVFTAFVGLAIVAAVIMIILGGFGYVMSALPSEKSDGKKKIQEAVSGLLLLFVSTILLYTINPDLLRSGLKLKKVSIISSGTTSVSETGVPQNTNTETTAPSTSSGNEQENREILANNGHITVNAQAPQTILAGVNDATLSEVTNLQQQCNCDIVVTAGSEPGHANGTYSHANGYKVDLRTSSSVSNYIMDNYTNIGKRSDGAMQYKAPSGAIYALESDHWDVTVK